MHLQTWAACIPHSYAFFFLSQRLGVSVLLNSAFSKNFNQHVNESGHWKGLKYNDEFLA